MLQNYFEKFHDAIKLDTENKDLRDSRDAIKNRINLSFEEYFQDSGIPHPTFFDQGSYAMGTGVKPADNETYYDIDEGIKFPINAISFQDPVDIKILIKNVLKNHTDLGVKIMGPCVRVIYSEQGEEKYHVDLAIYATNGQSKRGSVIQLARGKEFSEKENRYWENSQPEALIDYINNRFQDDIEQAQFRRIIKYLKRWKDIHFPSSGNAAPRGIALTIAAYQYFIPVITPDGNPDDLQALIIFTNALNSNVSNTFYECEYVKRLICKLPVEPFNDLFGKMTNNNMDIFLNKLSQLNYNLKEVQGETYESNAVLLLAKIFGDDFPSPELEKTFVNIKKPSLGYYPELDTIPGYNTAPIVIDIKGHIRVNSHWIPISSDKRVMQPDKSLMFEAISNVNSNDIVWRVVNTGNHVINEAKIKSGSNPFRGNWVLARGLSVARNNSSKIIPVNSSDPMVTRESTLYTGKHWIECIARENGICIAKSNRFFVNIYNNKFPNYD